MFRGSWGHEGLLLKSWAAIKGSPVVVEERRARQRAGVSVRTGCLTQPEPNNSGSLQRRSFPSHLARFIYSQLINFKSVQQGEIVHGSVTHHGGPRSSCS